MLTIAIRPARRRRLPLIGILLAAVLMAGCNNGTGSGGVATPSAASTPTSGTGGGGGY